MTTALKPQVIEGSGGIPPEPDWSETYTDILDVAAAHEEWGIIIREMQEAQTVSVANGHAIGRLVHFRLLYRHALQQVAERGAVLKGKGQRQPRFSPHWGVMRQAADLIAAIESELGLAPVRRGKAMKAHKANRSQRAADAYIKPLRTA